VRLCKSGNVEQRWIVKTYEIGGYRGPPRI
jgi:hypothetical protein